MAEIISRWAGGPTGSPAPNLVFASDTVITPSSELVTSPASYLKNNARWAAWVSEVSTGSPPGDEDLVFEFGGARTVKVVQLINWKAHTGGSILAQYWDGSWQPFGTFVLEAFNPTEVISVWNETGVSTTKIRILFQNDADAEDYVQLGVAVIGTY